MLLALLVLAADPAPLEHALSVASLAIFILVYFGAQNLFKGHSDRASEGFIDMMIFASLNILLSGFIVQYWASRFPVKY